METPSRNQILLRQYLMGEMSEQEQDNLEEKYFNDDDLFGELLDTEDEVIEEYRRGRLSPTERERFERRFLTIPDRRWEVEFVSLLAESRPDHAPWTSATDQSSGSNAEPAPRRRSLYDRLRALTPIPVWMLTTAALILAIISGWELMKISRPLPQREAQPENQAANANQAQPAPEERVRIEEELAKLQTQPVPAQAMLSFTLSRGASRGSQETKTVNPDAKTTLIEFTLDAGAENYAGYQARLQKSIDERDLLLIQRLKAKPSAAGKNVIVRLPVARLETDDYQITLEGLSPRNDTSVIGKYRFKVRPQ